MNVEIKFYNALFGEELKDLVNDDNILTTLDGEELTDVQIIQEIDPLSEYLAANACDITLINKTDKVLKLTVGQVGKVYYYDNYMATVVIDEIKRNGEYEYKVTCTDYIGALDNMTYAGLNRITVSSLSEANAYDTLDSILSQTGIPYYLSPDLKNVGFRGIIEKCTVREVIGKICFVCGAVATTANLEELKIYKLSDAVNQTVSKNKVRQSPSFFTSPPPATVNLAYYRTFPGESEEIYTVDAPDLGTIKYHETETAYMAYVTYRENEILEASPYFTKVKIGNNSYRSGLSAQPVHIYQYLKSKENSDASATGVVEIKDQKIVTSENVDDILERCYNYYMKSNTATVKINEETYADDIVKYAQAEYGDVIYGDKIPPANKIELGETITVDADYMGEITGIVKSIRFNLNGNMIVKECEIVY